METKRRTLKPKKGFHLHHKIPIHAGGEDVDENLVYLTIDEHIQAHLDLYEKYGKEADLDSANLLLACRYRENCEVKYENFIRACRRGGEAAHVVKLGNGFYKRLGEHNSQVLKGRIRPDLAKAKTEEWAEKNWKWFNNGIEDRRLEKQLEGWIPGRLHRHDSNTRTCISNRISCLKWYNDGMENRRLTECPVGWAPGRVSKKGYHDRATRA